MRDFWVPRHWGSVYNYALARYLEVPSDATSPGPQGNFLTRIGDHRLPWIHDHDGELFHDVSYLIKLGQVAEHLLFAEWFGAALVASARLLDNFRAPENLAGSALRLFVPDFEALEWEQIAEIRQHPGMQEARHRLRQWELRAAELGACGDAEQDRLARLVVADLLAAMNDARPRLAALVGKEIVMTATTLVPGVGPAVAKAVSLEETARAVRNHGRSWHAALIDLQNQSPKPSIEGDAAPSGRADEPAGGEPG